MPDHDHIGTHRVQCDRGIDQRFALLHARLRGVHVHDVGAEAFARNFEAEQGARRVFEKRIYLRQAIEAVIRFAVRSIMINPLVRLIQQK